MTAEDRKLTQLIADALAKLPEGEVLCGVAASNNVGAVRDNRRSPPRPVLGTMTVEVEAYGASVVLNGVQVVKTYEMLGGELHCVREDLLR